MLKLNERDHFFGPANAKLTLVEFADFQCPYSATAADALRETLRDYQQVVRFCFRHFPLTYLHRHALLAAQAAEAAACQGKFWEMHTLLFEQQEQFQRDSVLKFARQLKLDEDQFSMDLSGDETFEKIKTDVESARVLSLDKTPSFYLNGAVYQNEWHESGLKHQIEAALRELEGEAEPTL